MCTKRLPTVAFDHARRLYCPRCTRASPFMQQAWPLSPANVGLAPVIHRHENRRSAAQEAHLCACPLYSQGQGALDDDRNASEVCFGCLPCRLPSGHCAVRAGADASALTRKREQPSAVRQSPVFLFFRLLEGCQLWKHSQTVVVDAATLHVCSPRFLLLTET